MRTTLTLEDDVALALRRHCEERGVPWKQAVNEFLRRGLATRLPSPERKEYSVTPHDAGALLMPPDLVSTDDMLAWAEGDTRP